MSRPNILILVLFLTIFSLIYPLSVDAEATLDRVHYLLIGNIDKIEALQLDLDYRFDNLNILNLVTSYDGQNIGLEGTWNINFAGQGKNKMYLGLTLATKLNNISFKKAISLSGEGSYLTYNKYYWSVKHFLDNEIDGLIYSGGISLPITDDSYLTLGLGKSLWSRDRLSFNIGVDVNL